MLFAAHKILSLKLSDHPNTLEYTSHAKYWITRWGNLIGGLPSPGAASLLLAGLPPDYKAGYQHLLKNANSKKAKIRLEEIEQYLLYIERTVIDAPSNALKIGNFGKQDKVKTPGRTRRQDLICTNCKKQGHTDTKCWFLYLELAPYGWDKQKNKVKEICKTSIARSGKANEWPNEWLLDSGAEIHLTNIADRFDIYRLYHMEIAGIDDRTIQAIGIGSITFLTPHGLVQVTEVLYVP